MNTYTSSVPVHQRAFASKFFSTTLSSIALEVTPAAQKNPGSAKHITVEREVAAAATEHARHRLREVVMHFMVVEVRLAA